MAKLDALAEELHRETQYHLPWYLTGRLEPSLRARVDAHLSDCAECRVDLAGERRLMAEWTVLPIEAEHSWQQLRERLPQETLINVGAGSKLSSRLVRAGTNAWAAVRFTSPSLGWALAAAQAVALIMIGVSSQPVSSGGEYHSLGAAGPSTAGNILVMFHPDTSEQNVREILSLNHVRVVDGPTSAGAWLLQAPASGRGQTLVGLRKTPAVELAQPVDPGVTR